MKRSILILGVSVATLGLGACGHKDTNNSPDAAAARSAGMTDGNAVSGAGDRTAQAAAIGPGQTFTNTAAASDAFEIATSKLALEKASKPAIRKFAQQMITAHTASTAKLKSVSGSLSPAIVPDPTLAPDQQKALADLQTKTGPDFDSAYKSLQVGGHQKTLDALKSYAATGDVPALRTFASGLVPIVTAHLNMTNGL